MEAALSEKGFYSDSSPEGQTTHDPSCTEEAAGRRGSADVHIKRGRQDSCLCFIFLLSADQSLPPSL